MGMNAILEMGLDSCSVRPIPFPDRGFTVSRGSFSYFGTIRGSASFGLKRGSDGISNSHRLAPEPK